MRDSVVQFARIEPLEGRTMLAWGAYPQLIDQDLARLNYPQATGRGTAVAIIDTGVDFNHPVLAGTLWMNPGEVANDRIDNDRNGYVDDVNGYDFYRNDPKPEDENGHGTQMSGIIAGRNWTYDGFEYGGIAPETKLIHLKVADPTGRIGDLSFAQRIERALRWVERNHEQHNIVAVNLSVRVQRADFEATFQDEAARLYKAGVVLVAAGGHGGDFEGVNYPAADPIIFSAGIVDTNDQMSPKQQRGPELDMLAPGKAVPIIERFGQDRESGEATSYPTPFITAAAAVIKQINPNLTPAEVMGILKASGAPVVDPNSGRVHRRLDLDDAVRMASQTLPTPDPEPEPDPEPDPEPNPDPEPKPLPTGPQRPFRKNAFNVRQRIEFENFDRGGPGVSYLERGKTLSENAHRRDAAVQLKRVTSAWVVADTRDGEWLEYTLNVDTAGVYRFEASVFLQGAARLHVTVDGQRVMKSIRVPERKAGRGRRVSMELVRKKVKLTEGTHVVRVRVQTSETGPMLDSFRFVGQEKKRR